MYKHRVNNMYLEPKKNSGFLNKNQIFVNPGCYIRTGSKVKLIISNLGMKMCCFPGIVSWEVLLRLLVFSLRKLICWTIVLLSS